MEPFLCPCCRDIKVEIIGSRARKYLNEDASQVTLVIRRLRCLGCNKIHHELPNILVPYKRYKSECIEAVIVEDSNTPVTVACDESTLHRWKYWFKSLSEYFAGCLQSIAIQIGKETEETSKPKSVLHRIWQYVGDAPGWLARIVQPLVNSNLWVHTRSAFLSDCV
ncbi:MAG: DUF6431 domain-containing protein [Clostridia bacterium]|nr:DUF6431 domain-containing protein [Clostridia bacterium]MDD4681023.1 DUF6431 domain-containing protein [Clostridia bacterium]